MKNNDVYIAKIEKILPQKYKSLDVVNKIYPTEKYGESTNQLVKRLAKKFKIDERPYVLDLEAYPKISLAKEEYHPLNWGIKIINELTKTISKENIGFFSLSYNISYHTDTLPNLATQIAMKSGLNNLDNVEEIPYYGCAAAIYSIKNAINYCKENDRPALVFTFDQCSKNCLPLNNEDQDFKKMLVSNLLFTDGGVGLLIIPNRMKNYFDKPLMKLKGAKTKYKMGSLIEMKNERFLMNNNLRNIMPKLVSDSLLKPFLGNQNLTLTDIKEWAIHQGGSSVIKEFCNDKVLGLSDKQIKRSLDKFYKYGNTSSASCLLVLESFFNENNSKKKGTKGVILGFGAGYYLGIIAYEWV